MQLRTVLIYAVVLLGCPVTSRPDGGTPGEALQRQVLEQLDLKIVRPELAAFNTEAKALGTSVEAWAAAASADEAARLTEARAKYKTAFLAWQRLEIAQFGPLGAATRVTDGQGLRDELYSWPTTNLCRVDAALVAGTSTDDSYFDSALVTSKGFVVLEALLFVESTSTVCPADATIVTDGSWAALVSSGNLPARRKAWARGVARHIVRVADRAQTAWTKTGGFGDAYRAAGSMGSAWRTPKDGLDDAFAGLFYVDRFVKDLKLGGPAGITPACMAQACPELAESPHAKLSTAALNENLVTMRATFTGLDGPGFDDLLAERGASELRDEMLARLDAAIADAKQLPPIQDAATTNHDLLVDLHAQVKRFTDLLKSQFVTTLSLKVPKEGAGDND